MTDEPRVEALLRGEQIADLPEQVRAAHKQAMRSRIAADLAAAAPTRGPKRSRRRWGRAGTSLLVGGVVLVGAGTATGFLLHAQPDDPQVVRCFSVAAAPFTEGAPGSYDASYAATDGSLGESAVRATEVCGYGWAEGRLPWPETKPPGFTNPEPQPVPELQACVLPDGIVGVFPGSTGICIRLGLPSFAA